MNSNTILPLTATSRVAPLLFNQTETADPGRHPRRRMVDIERKSFSVALKDNPRGRFLRITEKNGTRHATIIIPSTGLKEFQQCWRT